MLAGIAMGIAMLALIGAAVAYIKAESHQDVVHGTEKRPLPGENAGNKDETNSCAHSPRGGKFWQAGYAQGKADGQQQR